MYLQYSPQYLSSFAKCLEDIVHHQHVHLCWRSILTAVYSMDKFLSCVVPGPSQWLFHFGKEIVIAWTQGKTTTLGGTEPHHSSWQCKESLHCCHGSLASLSMGDSGTSTVLTRYESMRLRSLRQSERTTVVQHKRWTYLCYNAVNMEHQQRWMHWWCTMPYKHLAKGDKWGWGKWLYWRHINVVPLWIKPCQKYRTVTFYFYRTVVFMSNSIYPIVDKDSLSLHVLHRL